jgi:hypothetical protein
LGTGTGVAAATAVGWRLFGRRRGWTVAGVLATLLLVAAPPATHAGPPVFAGPVPGARCALGDLPERTQGRVPASDVTSGRAVKGYRCNAALVAHLASTAGYKVQRYVDRHARQCAYYDSTRAFPTDVPSHSAGTFVVDMGRPTRPVLTATLRTPAMLSPHESLLVNQRRGLLVADMGSPTTMPGFLDVYDLTLDCRHPRLESSTPLGILGHESAFAPDGLTYYVSALVGHGIAAIGLEDPALPTLLTLIPGALIHGMSTSDDGTRLYVADIANSRLDVLDVSQIQRRQPAPRAVLLSTLTWPEVSFPQTTRPFVVRGHHYLMEVDEFTALTGSAQVGAARIIDIQNERHPFVVANLRLAVHMPTNRGGEQAKDPGAGQPLGGYAAHYCSLPRTADPGIIACTMIKSGLRIFDVRDPLHPREVAYFNRPPSSGSSNAVSSIAFDPARREVWYSDSASGFWVVRLTSTAWPTGGSH